MTARPGAQDFFSPPEIDEHLALDTTSSNASFDNNSLVDYFATDDNSTLSSHCCSVRTFNDSEESDTSTAITTFTVSEKTMTTVKSQDSEKESNTGDFLPKSFLQLKGISVGNFNMN